MSGRTEGRWENGRALCPFDDNELITDGDITVGGGVAVVRYWWHCPGYGNQFTPHALRHMTGQNTGRQAPANRGAAEYDEKMGVSA